MVVKHCFKLLSFFTFILISNLLLEAGGLATNRTWEKFQPGAPVTGTSGISMVFYDDELFTGSKMAVLELFSQPELRRYSASIFTKATFVRLLCVLLIFVPPILIVYACGGVLYSLSLH